MTDNIAFPIPEQEGQRTIKFEVVLDFDKMYESVLEKHWGWMGDRPESFEEYCCMAVASQLFDHIKWNEFRASDALDIVRGYLEQEGKDRARSAVAWYEEHGKAFSEYGKNADGSVSVPEDYYVRQVKIYLDSLARQEAKRIHDEKLSSKCAEDNDLCDR